MLRIEFCNSKDKAIFVQVDPWACLYKLDKGDRIELAIDDKLDEPFISIDDYDDDQRIVTLERISKHRMLAKQWSCFHRS